MPKISVIMPVYNAGKFVSEAILSILNQTFVDFEFIVVDDGSTDNSWDVIQTFSDDRMITIRNGKNIGNCKSRNFGISKSKGKYVAVMDADDIALPDRLWKQYNYMESNPATVAIGAQLNFLGTERKTEMPVTYHEICAGLLDNSRVMHPTLFVRADVIKQLGGYDEQYKYASDYDLACRLSLTGKIENLPDTCVVYRLHPDQISHAKRLEQQEYADVIRQKYQIAFINSHKSAQLPEVGEDETGYPAIGHVIGLYIMSECINPSFRDQADRLLGFNLDNLHSSIPICIKKGMLGIGSGVMYLLRNHFVSGDEDEVLENIDDALYNYISNYQMNSDFDWEGSIYYLRQRALMPYRKKTSVRLKITKALIQLKFYRKTRQLFPKYFQRKTNSVYFQVKAQYMRLTGKRLSYCFPRDMNEKLHWLTRYWQHPLKTKCADKYLVREYVKECGCEGILVPLVGVYNSANDIDFDALPSKFALKCNHGYGYNILCKDKANFDKENAIARLNGWLLEDFSKKAFEFHYSKIVPKVICEQYLEVPGEKSLVDYKIHCFNGEPAFFIVCTERDSVSHSVVLSSYSLTWEKLSLMKNEGDAEIPKPKLLEEMIAYARILSKPFPYVRVDLYYVKGKIYFGELTFSPSRNIMSSYKDSTLKMMGKKLKLPQKI